MSNLVVLIDKLQKSLGMGGWVTWLSATLLVLLGAYKIYQDQTEIGMWLILNGTGLVGIGRKNEKIIGDVKNVNSTMNSVNYAVKSTRSELKGMKSDVKDVGITVEEVCTAVEGVSESQDKIELEANKAKIKGG